MLNTMSTGGSEVVVSTPDFQAGGSGFDSWAGTNGNFLKYSNRGSGGSELHLKLVGPIIKRSVTSREEAPYRGANYLGVILGDFERFVCTDSVRNGYININNSDKLFIVDTACLR